MNEMRALRSIILILILILCLTAVLTGCDMLKSEGEESTSCTDGHTPGEQKTVVKASCTSAGSAEATCTACGETVTVEIPALGHKDSDWIEDVAAGCNTVGARHKRCLRCGVDTASESLPAHGHTPDEWVIDKAVGCFTDGARHRNCAECGAFMEKEVVIAVGHVEGMWRATQSANCEREGTEMVSCRICGQLLKTRKIPALGHDYEWQELTAATCLASGSEQQHCARNGCGAVGEIRATELGTHTEGEWVVDDAGSCLEQGYRHMCCAVCDVEIASEYFYPENAHRPSEWVVERTSTCEVAGSKYCNCLDCGRELYREALPLAHVPGEWVMLTPASCSAEGAEQQLCLHCLQPVDVRPIPRLAHTPGEWIQTIAPACEREGVRVRTCAYCETAVDSERVPATGHPGTTEWQLVQAATCSVEGRQVKKCTACEKELYEQAVPTTPHPSGDWAEALSADTLPSAHMVWSCTVCGGVIDATKTLNKEEYVRTSGTESELSLSGYRFVYPAGASASFVARVKLAAAKLAALTGQSVSTVSDSSTAATTKEILVGNVNRAQASAALADVSGYGYTVQLSASKIVIAGTTDLIALMGLEYFEQTYLSGSTRIKMPQKAISDRYRPVTLVTSNGTVPYSLVYSKDLDTSTSTSDPDTYYGVVSGSGMDYAYDATLDIRDALYSFSGITATLRKDNSTVSTKEILVGMPNRTEVRAALALLAGHQYGIVVMNDRVMVTAYSTLALQAVVPIFTDYLGDAQTDDGSIVLPANLRFFGEPENAWFTDAPLPDGLPLYNTADEGDGLLQYLYMGDGVTKAAFDAYCAKLRAAGYTAVSENSAEGSVFITFTNTSKKTMVHAAYNAYTHASGSNWSYPSPAIRVITGYTNGVANMLSVPSAELRNPNQSYTKVTDSAITAVPLPSSSVGTGYVITLEDGTFIVIDGGAANGGMNNGSNPWYEVNLLYNILADLHKQIWGSAPSASNPIHIRAWHITHAHSDHMNVFWDFAHRYGVGSGNQKLGKYAKLDYLIANTPAPSMVYNTGEPSMELRNNMEKIRGYFGGFTHLNVQTGQKLYFANVELEVLFTHGDLNPQRIVTFNDTSTVIRFTFTPTNGSQKGTPVSFVSTGDAYRHSARWMCAIYGDYLKSDMVTLSHHGGPGTETGIYERIAPKVLWWPHVAASIYSGYLKSSNWYSKVDQYAFFELSSVEYVYISDKYAVTLWLTYSGPQYDAVRDANTGNVIESYTLTASQKVASSHEIYTKQPVVVKRKRS